METESESSKSSTATSLQTAYGEAANGKSSGGSKESEGASASATNKTSTKESSGSCKVTVDITSVGHKMHTYINADTLEEAATLHRDFGLNTGGTGISLILQPYTSHHDY